MRGTPNFGSPKNTNQPVEGMWDDLRSQYRSVYIDEEFIESIKQTPDLLRDGAIPVSFKNDHDKSAHSNLRLRWLTAVAAAITLVAFGIGSIVVSSLPPDPNNQDVAVDSDAPETPSSDSTTEKDNKTDLASRNAEPELDEIPTELAISRLVLQRLDEGRRSKSNLALRKLRKDRITREESWERVAATLTYAADYETKRQRERESKVGDTNFDEPLVSPLYQVVVDLAPASRWAEQAREKLHKMP